jgi:hypothetical protein
MHWLWFSLVVVGWIAAGLVATVVLYAAGITLLLLTMGHKK